MSQDYCELMHDSYMLKAQCLWRLKKASKKEPYIGSKDLTSN